MSKLSTMTPWGFTLEEAVEAFKFRQSVIGDRSAFNGHNPDRSSVYSLFPDLLCRARGCDSMMVARKDLPDFKGKDRLGVSERYCEEHYRKLWNFARQKREKAALRRKAFDEWLAAEKRREIELGHRRYQVKYPHHKADELERKAQERELRGLRAEREQELKDRANLLKKRYTGPPRAGFVYRLYDAEKALLYVGKTYSLKARLFGKGGHAQTKEWFSGVLVVQVTEYRTEADALLAEGFAIRRENPRHNVRVPAQKTGRSPGKVSEYWELVSALV